MTLLRNLAFAAACVLAGSAAVRSATAQSTTAPQAAPPIPPADTPLEAARATGNPGGATVDRDQIRTPDLKTDPRRSEER